jgi:hypothetical protein
MTADELKELLVKEAGARLARAPERRGIGRLWRYGAQHPTGSSL